jgi:hypothetical protein
VKQIGGQNVLRINLVLNGSGAVAEAIKTFTDRMLRSLRLSIDFSEVPFML